MRKGAKQGYPQVTQIFADCKAFQPKNGIHSRKGAKIAEKFKDLQV
jgi:hypothetical protein